VAKAVVSFWVAPSPSALGYSGSKANISDERFSFRFSGVATATMSAIGKAGSREHVRFGSLSGRPLSADRGWKADSGACS